MEEYTALNRYISTAQARRRESTTSADLEEADKKKPWWKFWQRAGGEGGEQGFVCPDDWLETDIHTGLSSHDIEPRRKRSGWNELSTEKTNFFLQFIGYFRGPILYGKLWRFPFAGCRFNR